MVPDSVGSLAGHQPEFLTSHDRQKPKIMKKKITEQIMEWQYKIKSLKDLME